MIGCSICLSCVAAFCNSNNMIKLMIALYWHGIYKNKLTLDSFRGHLNNSIGQACHDTTTVRAVPATFQSTGDVLVIAESAIRAQILRITKIAFLNGQRLWQINRGNMAAVQNPMHHNKKISFRFFDVASRSNRFIFRQSKKNF